MHLLKRGPHDAHPGSLVDLVQAAGEFAGHLKP